MYLDEMLMDLVLFNFLELDNKWVIVRLAANFRLDFLS